MTLTAQQKAIIERRLPIGSVGEGAEPPVQISLSARELRFIIEAVAHYSDAQCALQGEDPDCALMYWYESAQGHIERACEHFCERLIDALIQQVPEKR